jgi:hypothetical protein
MSQSPPHALSTRLFIQAALTGLLAPTAAGGSTWLVLTLAVAGGGRAVAASALAVALLLRRNPANARVMVVGFEAVALVVGGLGLAGGHYIPGTIIGVVTLITALNLPTGPAVDLQAQRVVPPPVVAAPQPLRPEDIAPASRALTILPGH